MIVAYMVVRKSFSGKETLDFVSNLGGAVPGTILGIGYIVAFINAPIVVVADTRVVHGILHYFSNLYNTNLLLFAIWAVVLTAAYGGFLGLIMDKLMSLTGLDRKSRKIVEH